MLLEYKFLIFVLNCDTLNLAIFTNSSLILLAVTKYSNLSSKTKLSTKKQPKLIQLTNLLIDFLSTKSMPTKIL